MDHGFFMPCAAKVTLLFPVALILSIARISFSLLGRLESGIKKSVKHYKNGLENGLRTEWDEEGRKSFQGNYVDGNEE